MFKKTAFLLIAAAISFNAVSSGNQFRFNVGTDLSAINTIGERPITAPPDEVTDSESVTEEEKDPNCYSAENMGTVGEWSGCNGKIIVDNDTLKELVASDGDYSDSAIFTGQVTSFSGLFNNKVVLHPIGGWDTSNVVDMNWAFQNATNVPDLSRWNTSNVTTMFRMFSYSDFNGAVSNWDVSKVTNLEGTFRYSPFNQSINNWNLLSATNLTEILRNTPYNHNTRGLCIPNVDRKPTNFATNLAPQNEPLWGYCEEIDGYATSDCDDPQYLNKVGVTGACQGRLIVDSDTLKNWKASKAFYGDSNIYTGQVTDMSGLFSGVKPIFSIEGWNVSNVKQMRWLFQNSGIDQDLSNWDTSSATNMYRMFYRSAYSGSLKNWCVPNVSERPNNFSTNIPDGEEPVWGTCPQ